MIKYTNEDIKAIISDVRTSMVVNSPKEIRCSSAEELISDLSQYAKYVIPEKREEWCDLIRSIIYDVQVPVPPLLGSNIDLSLRAREIKDESICREIFYFIWVAEIMEAYHKDGDLNVAIETFKSQNHQDQDFYGVIHEVLRFSMFGPEFVRVVVPERINKNNSFKNEYLKAIKYLKGREALEQRFINAIARKEYLEEYKEYLINVTAYACDEDSERKEKRKENLSQINDSELQSIIDNTYRYAVYLLKKMYDEDNTSDYSIFTTVDVNLEYRNSIDLGLTGGHKSDILLQVPFGDEKIVISKYLLERILKNISIQEDFDIYPLEDGDIVCEYEYLKLVFVMKLADFNKVYTELIENRSLAR